MSWEPGYREVPATDDPPEYDPMTDEEQDEAELAWESYYHPTDGDRGGPDGN